jgi:hypothetical protein
MDAHTANIHEYGPMLLCIVQWNLLPQLLLYINDAIACGIHINTYFHVHTEKEKIKLAKLYIQSINRHDNNNDDDDDVSTNDVNGNDSRSNTANRRRTSRSSSSSSSSSSSNDMNTSSYAYMDSMLAVRYLGFLISTDTTRTAILTAASNDEHISQLLSKFYTNVGVAVEFICNTIKNENNNNDNAAASYNNIINHTHIEFMMQLLSISWMMHMHVTASTLDTHMSAVSSSNNNNDYNNTSNLKQFRKWRSKLLLPNSFIQSIQFIQQYTHILFATINHDNNDEHINMKNDKHSSSSSSSNQINNSRSSKKTKRHSNKESQSLLLSSNRNQSSNDESSLSPALTRLVCEFACEIVTLGFHSRNIPIVYINTIINNLLMQSQNQTINNKISSTMLQQTINILYKVYIVTHNNAHFF